MVSSNPITSIITLSVNGFNLTMKKTGIRLGKKLSCTQATHLKHKGIHRLKIKGWKKIYLKH